MARRARAACAWRENAGNGNPCPAVTLDGVGREMDRFSILLGFVATSTFFLAALTVIVFVHGERTYDLLRAIDRRIGLLHNEMECANYLAGSDDEPSDEPTLECPASASVLGPASF